jgi:3-hydroxyisobutyrate dehydrogenase-like beta-hydroxyacid dehydrogenase
MGASVARHLAAQGVKVLEVDRPKRQVRRQRGKSGASHVGTAARAVPAGEGPGTPKTALPGR